MRGPLRQLLAHQLEQRGLYPWALFVCKPTSQPRPALPDRFNYTMRPAWILCQPLEKVSSQPHHGADDDGHASAWPTLISSSRTSIASQPKIWAGTLLVTLSAGS